jgi:hypothetical protein
VQSAAVDIRRGETPTDPSAALGRIAAAPPMRRNPRTMFQRSEVRA